MLVSVLSIEVIISRQLGIRYQVDHSLSSDHCRQRVVNQGRLEDRPPVTPPRVESPGHLGELPEQGLPSRYEVEMVLLGYDILRWSSYAEFREAVHREAEMEWMVDTLVDTHLVLLNLPE